jgi:hypothetical protein
MEFKSLSPTAWETERWDFDFHIRLEQDDYVIDVFENGVDNADDAYITTHTCESWAHVERFCRDFDGTPVL